MKRHVALSVLGVLIFALADSHLDTVSRDGGTLLVISGREVDPQGWFSEQWRQWTQDCSPVKTEPTDSDVAISILKRLAQHSLPDSENAQLTQLQVQGDWAIAHVAFPLLNPSVVVLHRILGEWSIQEGAVWSGDAAPWNEANFVRRYLLNKQPLLPQALLNCSPIGNGLRK